MCQFFHYYQFRSEKRENIAKSQSLKITGHMGRLLRLYKWKVCWQESLDVLIFVYMERKEKQLSQFYWPYVVKIFGRNVDNSYWRLLDNVFQADGNWRLVKQIWLWWRRQDTLHNVNMNVYKLLMGWSDVIKMSIKQRCHVVGILALKEQRFEMWNLNILMPGWYLFADRVYVNWCIPALCRRMKVYYTSNMVAVT